MLQPPSPWVEHLSSGLDIVILPSRSRMLYPGQLRALLGHLGVIGQHDDRRNVYATVNGAGRSVLLPHRQRDPFLPGDPGRILFVLLMSRAVASLVAS